MVDRVVPCPHCGEPAPWSQSNRWRPFCSERCKMIDLGAWADERYRLPAEGEADTAAAVRDDES